MRGLTDEERHFLTTPGATCGDDLAFGLQSRGLVAVESCDGGERRWRATAHGLSVVRLDGMAREARRG